MKSVLDNVKILAIVSLGFAAIPGIVMAGPIIVDGVKDGNDAYTNSFDATWTNEHHKDGSIYQDGTNVTTVSWEQDSGSFYLFLEAPIEAKNMIWGTGVTAAELALYDIHNTSLGHHGPLSGIDYEKATGSEKALFAGITANLKAKKAKKKKGDADDADDGELVTGASGLVSSANSLGYLVDNSICDLTNCAATATTMSFEFEFDLSSAAFQALLDDIASNGIEFHLSPERGVRIEMPQIPGPATLPLMLFGALGLFAASRRRINTTSLRT